MPDEDVEYAGRGELLVFGVDAEHRPAGGLELDRAGDESAALFVEIEVGDRVHSPLAFWSGDLQSVRNQLRDEPVPSDDLDGLCIQGQHGTPPLPGRQRPPPPPGPAEKARSTVPRS